MDNNWQLEWQHSHSKVTKTLQTVKKDLPLGRVEAHEHSPEATYVRYKQLGSQLKELAEVEKTDKRATKTVADAEVQINSRLST